MGHGNGVIFIDAHKHCKANSISKTG